MREVVNRFFLFLIVHGAHFAVKFPLNNKLERW